MKKRSLAQDIKIDLVPCTLSEADQSTKKYKLNFSDIIYNKCFNQKERVDKLI